MKKLFIIFVTLITTVFLSSCGASHVDAPRNANQDLTLENLRALGIKPASMEGVYVTLHKAGALYKDPEHTSQQGVEGGAVIILDRLSGDILEVPKKVPILYKDGPKEGKPYFIDGILQKEDFLVPIVSLAVDDNGLISEARVQIGNDSIGDVFVAKRKKVLRKRVGLQGTSSYRSGLRGLKRQPQKRHPPNPQNRIGKRETRLVFEPLTFQEGMELEPGYQVDRNGAIYFQQGSQRIYSLIGESGTQWFITQDFLNNFLDKFLVIKSTKNDKKRSTATSKRYGQ